MLSASLMCSNLLQLEKEIRILEELGIDYFHIDVMDGRFVKNFALGMQSICQIRQITDIPFDYHLMIEKPENVIDIFPIRENDIVTVHMESSHDLFGTLVRIREKGALAGLAINPNNRVEVLKPYFDYIDVILIMLVEPGFIGNKLVPGTVEKVGIARKIADSLIINNRIKIAVDGHVGDNNIAMMAEDGADIFVCGSSGLFGKDITYKEAIKKLRQNERRKNK